ncbi:6-aminohexanoate-dimer hydrolase [Enterococcus florum]|uniref:6-aminohexanoate-dimer hydrolase n=1 Tax=Enterococcus florum TaxID=2480627 RepID=A0A4P5PQ52_9ENTE|nr:serine hydrolase [Enterococcus florum]GCF95173.1 6-aminohexanoate-dimer hydrolase [Enterococcus florum]
MNQTELDQVIQEHYGNTAGLIIQQNGDMLYEAYFNNCDKESTIHLYSVTKSIVSLLIGIAIDKGYIKSEQQKILDFFPEYIVDSSRSELNELTIKHLLTMKTAYQFAEEPYEAFFTSEDWVRFVLDQLKAPLSEGFRYTPIIGPDLLTGILERATEKTVLDFAEEVLFGPLGLRVEKKIVFRSFEEQMAFYVSTTTSGWVADPTGTNAAGWGLTMTTSDLLRIGQCIMNQGVWEEDQLVSEEWLKKMTQEHNRWEEMDLPYGYLWWLLGDEEYAALGDGGNMLYINAPLKLVVAMTGLFAEGAADRVTFIKERLLPIMVEK